MQDENKALLARHFAQLWGLGDLLVDAKRPQRAWEGKKKTGRKPA